VVTAGSS